MRLTERKVCYPKSDKEGNLTKVDYIEIKDKDKGLAEEKLCQLEDIEDELGIELITLFKVLNSKTFYIKGNWGNLGDETSFKKCIQEINIDNLGNYIELFKGFKSKNKFENDLLNFKIHFGSCMTTLNIKDYGKTWALTKEELL